MGNGDNSSTDHPWQTKGRVKEDETTNDEKVKMIAWPFLHEEVNQRKSNTT